MEHRILIVEDNQTLAKVIANKLESKLNLKVDVAYTMQEAKLFLKAYKYFISILDLSLPDAPNGEIVQYALKKEQHVIIVSANLDKETRQTLLKKNIIDYINKQSIHDVNYIDYLVSSIDRLMKNQKHEVLVVDDSLVMRKQIQSMLENLFFKVITVAHGEEALGMLKAKPNISLVLTDYNMPVMNGLELTIEIRKEFSKDELCILALSANEEDEVSSLFLKNGANDFIKKPFSKEEFSCRINNSIEALENIQMVMNYANRDFLTGLYNRRYFYNAMEEYIESARETSEKFAIAMIDIDHFKKVNDTYGHEVGDKAIVSLADILRSSTNPNDVVSRFGGEEFCVVLKNINNKSAKDILERIRKTVESFHLSLPNKESLNFTISIGATIHDYDDSLDDTIGQADMMLYKAKNDGRNQLICDEH